MKPTLINFVKILIKKLKLILQHYALKFVIKLTQFKYYVLVLRLRKLYFNLLVKKRFLRII